MGSKYRRLLLGSACVLVLSSAIAGTGVITAHAATPAVTSVSPTSGSTEGGLMINIAGSGFTGVTSVQFGILNVTSTICPPPVASSAGCFQFVSDTSINAWTPAHKQAAAVDVQVTAGGVQSPVVAGDKFAFNAPTPEKASVSPNTGPGGTMITINPVPGPAESSGYDFATMVNFVPASGPTVHVATTPCTSSSGPTGCFDLQSDLVTVQAPSTGWVAGVPYDITVTTAGGTSQVNSPADQFTPTAGNVYTPTNVPFRLADTRAGSGHQLAGQSLTPGKSDFVQVVGQDGVVLNATAAVLNVTATNGTAASFFTAYAGGAGRPLASNLNFVAHQTIANLVTVPIGAGGVNIYNLAGTADAVVDLEGYFAPGPGPGGTFNPHSPLRISDTRSGSGQPNAGQRLSAGSILHVQATGAGGVPGSGVSAVVLNVTAVGPTGSSFLTVFPEGNGLPLASNLNFTPGKVVPNRVIVPVGTGGKVDIYNQQGSVDVVVDVGGWFSNATGTTGFTFTPTPPTRVADTRPRSGLPLAGQTVGPRGTLTVPVVTPAGLPAGAMAVAANVTVANTSASSFLTVFPNGQSPPLASDLNWVAGQVVPNLAITQIGSVGALAVFNNSGTVDVIVDVFGYWS
jgi:hypothetical protein